MWILYELLLVIGLLCYLPKALWRQRLPHAGWTMRVGRYSPEVIRRLQGQETIWIHAVSVGEVMAVQPVIQQLQLHHPQQAVVLSTVTPTGFQVATRALGHQGVAIYVPLDLRLCVRRALATLKPRLLVLVESEFWPTLIRLTTQRGIPIVVVNGRISAPAYRRYRWAKPHLKAILGSIRLFLMQTQADAERVMDLGAPPDRVRVLGSLKWDASLLHHPKPIELQAFAARLGLATDGTLLVAGSTHRGEERFLLDACQALRAGGIPVRLVIAPRHLERVDEVEDLVRGRGLSGQRVSTLMSTGQPWDVAIVDSLGRLPLYYSLATVVFIGGSLIPHGGQNPLEAASLGKPVLFGPFMQNFADITRQLLTHHAALQLPDASQLLPTLQQVLADPLKAQKMGAEARALVERLSGTSQRTLDALTPLLTQPSSTT